MVAVACREWIWLATNRERPCKWQHSPQFQDRSPDADSSGLPNTVEDADVEDSALENSLASSYWFGAWAAEETWTVRQTRGITCTTKRLPNENSRNLKNSVSAQCSTGCVHIIPTSSFVPIQRGPCWTRLYPVKAWIQRRCCENHEAAREVEIKIEGNRETALWLCCNLPVSTLRFEKFQVKIRISQPQLFKLREVHVDLHIFQSSTSKFAENSKKSDRQDPRTEHTPKKNLSIIFARSQSKLGPGFSLGFGPIQFLIGFMKPIHHRATWNLFDFSPRGNIQAATFKPLAPPQFLTVLISWFLNREKESPKKHEQPQKRGQICEKLRFWDFTIFSDVYEMYNAKSLLGEIEMWIFVCVLYVSCMFFRSSMLNQLSNFAPLCRFRRCAPCHLGSQPSNDPPEGSRGEGHWCSAERQLHLLLRRQVAVVHTDHKILHEPKTDWIWLSTGFFFQQTCVKRSWNWIKLPNYVELCGTPGHLNRKKKPVL